MSEGHIQFPAESYERPTAVTVLAVGNIILAFLCSCCSLWMIATPVFTEFQKSVFQQMSPHFEAEMRREIDRLLQKRKAAKTPQEQQQIDAQIATLKATKMPDMSKFVEPFTTPQAKAFFYGFGAAGLVINLLFFISGVGLFWMASWARKLAIGASIARIVEVLVSTTFNIVVITPAMAQASQAMMTEMQKMMPPGQPMPPMPNMAAFIQFQSIAWSLFSALLYCAWPIAVLIVLFLPDVREAFRSR